MVTITWKYAAGDEIGRRLQGGLREGRRPGGQGAEPAVPGVEFQALLTEIAAAKPDAVFAFFAGGGAVKFVKDYAAAGPEEERSRCTARASSPTARSRRRAPTPTACSPRCTTATASSTPRDSAFRLAYVKAYKLQPDVYAVQGYDAAQMLADRPERGEGRHRARRPSSPPRCEKAKIDSPRGPFTISKSHNPVQDIYLRQVMGKENKVIGVAEQEPGRPGPRLQDVEARSPGRLGRRLAGRAAQAAVR